MSNNPSTCHHPKGLIKPFDQDQRFGRCGRCGTLMRWNGKYWELPHKHHTTMPDDQQEIGKQLRLFFLKYTQAMGDVMAQKGVLMETLAMLASRLSTESQIEVRNFLELVQATEAAHVQFFERLYQG